MKKMVTQDYLDLKKNINSYSNKYPSPNRETNIEWLKELNELKPYIETDKEKEKQYYKLRDKIVLSNGGFAMKYVMKYIGVLNDNTSIGELFQEASMGVIEAIDTFDITKNTSFTTYAYFHIRKRIIHFIRYNKIIRAPRDIARNLKHVSQVRSSILAKSGNEATPLEIQKELKISKDIDLKISIIKDIIVLLELNSSGYEESFVIEYKDQFCTDEESQLFRDMELNILNSISDMSERIQEIIKLRYGIGREFSHSPEEVRLMLKPTKEEELYLE
jgi:RNA polymerase sigma factor (sigma-70 family)